MSVNDPPFIGFHPLPPLWRNGASAWQHCKTIGLAAAIACAVLLVTAELASQRPRRIAGFIRSTGKPQAIPMPWSAGRCAATSQNTFRCSA